ncbi:S-adenosyl-L-methionine-dependent methyltransferase [Annulohypoxylon stygium]|nr:S-adenosyl-L-methionine-dependent methyltransferase [Annulohypoxylon stygium]
MATVSNTPAPAALPEKVTETLNFTNGTNKASRDVAWYQAELKQIPETAKQIFQNYSKINEDELFSHIYRVRDEAWEILPYVCIGCFRFLDFPASLSPAYPEVLERLRAGETLLDMGCGLGQDIRKYIYDGAPADNLIGVDVEPKFHDLGRELFKDRDTLKARLVTGDVFDDNFLSEFRGKIDIIFVGSFLHLFTYEQQVKIMAHITKLLRNRKGSMIFGRHMATAQTGGTYKDNALGWSLYYHSPDTINQLLESSSEGKWDVETKLIPYSTASTVVEKGMSWQGGDDVKQMYFSAEKL